MKELLEKIRERLVKVDKEYLDTFGKLDDKTKNLSIMEKVELTTKLNFYSGQKIALEYVAAEIRNSLEVKWKKKF